MSGAGDDEEKRLAPTGEKLKWRSRRSLYRDFGCLLPGEKAFVTTLARTFRDLPLLLRWICAGSGRRERIVGWIAFGPDTDERGYESYWLHRIAVHPRERRRGFAAFALREAIRQAPIGSEILSSVAPGNRAGAAMLRSVGLRRTRRMIDGCDRIYRMRKARYWK